MLVSLMMLLIETVSGFFTAMLLARFFMQWQRISFRNQLGQFVITVTDWIVRPARRVVPGSLGLDLASLLSAWALQTLAVFLERLLISAPINDQPVPLLFGLLFLGALAVVQAGLYLLMALVLFSALLSWVNPHAPIAPVLEAIVWPFLRPIRRLVPTIANVDLSPLVALVLIQALLIGLGGLRMALLPMVLG